MMGIAPGLAGNAAVIGGPGFIGMADIGGCCVMIIAVALHNALYPEILGGLDEHPHHIFAIPQHPIRCPADDDAGPVFSDAADDGFLGGHCLLDYPGAQIQYVQDSGGIYIDIGYEGLFQPGFLGGQGGELLIIEGNAQLFCYQLADLLALGAVLPGDSDDAAGLGGADNGIGRLRRQSRMILVMAPASMAAMA